MNFLKTCYKMLHLQAGDPGELVMWLQSKHSRRRNVLAEDRQREQILPHPTLCSTQESDGLGEIHPHGGGQSA